MIRSYDRPPQVQKKIDLDEIKRTYRAVDWQRKKIQPLDTTFFKRDKVPLNLQQISQTVPLALQFGMLIWVVWRN